MILLRKMLSLTFTFPLFCFTLVWFASHLLHFTLYYSPLFYSGLLHFISLYFYERYQYLYITHYYQMPKIVNIVYISLRLVFHISYISITWIFFSMFSIVLKSIYLDNIIINPSFSFSFFFSLIYFLLMGSIYL